MRKRIFALLSFAVICFDCNELVAQQVFWASEVLQFSTQFGTKGYSAKQVLGKPNALPQYGKSLVAWAPQPNTKNAFVVVGFEKATQVQQIAVGENLRAGSISKIILYDEKGKDYTVFERKNPSMLIPDKARMFTHFIPLTPYKVSKLRLELDYSSFRDIPQIDCIGISADKKTIEAKINTVDFAQAPGRAENLGPNVNSPYEDMLPIISPDGKTLYFARKKAPENFGAEKRDDIYFSERNVMNQWTKARNIGAPLNTDDHNFVCAISPDGQTMYLANRYDYRTEGDGVSVAYRKKDGTWTKPKPLEIKNMYNKSPFACYHVGIDDKTMVMAIERDNTFGDMDLYVSFRYADGTWSEPMNMGPDVNSAGAEASVFLAADGKTIYFSSNGHSGYGDFDMFVCRRLDNSWRNWSEPVNLGSLINSPGRDIYYTIPASGDFAYFSSDYYGYGQNDIFRILLPKELRPEPVNISAALYPSSAPEEENPALKPYELPSTSEIDTRINLLKQQLQQAQKGQPVSPAPTTTMAAPTTDPISEISRQQNQLEQELSDLQQRFQALQQQPNTPQPTQNKPNPSLSQPGWTAIPPPSTPYDPSYDQRINDYKRQLETIRLRQTTPTSSPTTTTEPPKSTANTNSGTLSQYEEKLKRLEQEQQARSNIPPTQAPKSKPTATNAPKAGPDASGNKALTVYEEKLRKMEEAKQKQSETPVVVAEPIRISSPAKEESSIEADTLPSEPFSPSNARPSFVYIPEMDSLQGDSSTMEIIYCEVLPADDLALLEKKMELEKEIERLQKEKESLAEENAKNFRDAGQILANTEQMLSEKESLALSINQLMLEREQLEREKEKLEAERKKLEQLKSQQYKDINSLKKELDSLLKIQEQALAVKNNYATVVDELESSKLEVGKVLSMKNVYFVANASFLQSRSYEELDKLVLYLKKNPGMQIEIGGHTNGLCDDAYCNELSMRRAKTVVDYLVSKGISASRLSYKGYGKTQNIADNRTEEGRKLNQRVEIRITGLGN